MIEGLVILRDVILAVLLSWIGVDYQEDTSQTADAQQAAHTLSSDPNAPLILISHTRPAKQSLDCPSTQLVSS